MKFKFRIKRIYKPFIAKLMLFASLVVINEFFVYEWCFMKWNINYNRNFQRYPGDLNILFVADPQLIGIEYEKRLFEDVIRWDCDKFLEHGFTRALRYATPEVVVFLGDIFDEGEVATDLQFETYMLRFKRIYLSKLPKETKVIIIPGDNDVGGEGMKAKLKALVKRFSKNFRHQYPYIDTFDNLNFIASDVSSRIEFEDLKTYFVSHAADLKYKHNILLNHNSFDIDKTTLTKFGVSVIVAAHSHLSKFKVCNLSSSLSDYEGDSLETYQPLDFQMKSEKAEILEITVPTCSYRMGVPYPGLGYMTVGSDGTIRYAVLWLPYRFVCLCTYIVALIVLVLFSFLRLF